MHFAGECFRLRLGGDAQAIETQLSISLDKLSEVSSTERPELCVFAWWWRWPLQRLQNRLTKGVIVILVIIFFAIDYGYEYSWGAHR